VYYVLRGKGPTSETNRSVTSERYKAATFSNHPTCVNLVFRDRVWQN